MLRNNIRGLRSCVFPGIDMPGRRTETIDDDEEDIYEYLEEKLLSPKTLSELHFPPLDQNTLNEKFIMSKIPNEKLAIVQTTLPCNDETDEWDTIETTVVYDNGVKESFLNPDFDAMEECQNDLTLLEKYWEYFANIFLRLCCSKSSSELKEISEKLSFVIDNVDRVSSRLFPITFLLINIVYWVVYIYVL